MNYHEVIFLGSKFTCKPFTDIETNTNGVDVYDEQNNRIGELMGVEIPDSEDKDFVEKFETKVLEFIDENIW